MNKNSYNHIRLEDPIPSGNTHKGCFQISFLKPMNIDLDFNFVCYLEGEKRRDVMKESKIINLTVSERESIIKRIGRIILISLIAAFFVLLFDPYKESIIEFLTTIFNNFLSLIFR